MTRQRHIDDFSIHLQLPILWGDMDAFQHVNNARFFRFFESARIHYFTTINLSNLLTTSHIGPILAKAGCTFIAPLTYPDTISIGCRTVEVTPSRLEQEYLIHSHKHNAASALGTATIVGYDYQSLQRAAFPHQALEPVLQHEGLTLQSRD